MTHAGIILAAGASSRMGHPKALLETPFGQPLAAYQSDLLTGAGCAEAVIVVGCLAHDILPHLNSHRAVENEHWEEGRLGSVQAGLKAAPGYDGYLVLPVDAAPIHATTLVELLAVAEQETRHVVRMRHGEATGHLAWFSRAVAEELLKIEDRSMRLDELIDEHAVFIQTADAAVLNNANTPGEWEDVLGRWPA